MATSPLMHIAVYIILAEIGGMFLWVGLKASIYANREWRRRDMFWTWFHGKDAALYLAIGSAALFGACRALMGV